MSYKLLVGILPYRNKDTDGDKDELIKTDRGQKSRSSRNRI